MSKNVKNGDVMNKSNQLQEEINDRIHKINSQQNELQRLMKEIKEEEFKLECDRNELEILNNREKRKVVENHGVGTIKIELKNNKIFVKHGVDDSLLFQRDSTPKTWSYLWETIESEK